MYTHAQSHTHAHTHTHTCPPPTPTNQKPARSGSHRHGKTTIQNMRAWLVDGLPQPIWPKLSHPSSPPKTSLGPEAGQKAITTYNLQPKLSMDRNMRITGTYMNNIYIYIYTYICVAAIYMYKCIYIHTYIYIYTYIYDTYI